MKKIPASLQKMRYDKQGEIVQVVCLVDSVVTLFTILQWNMKELKGLMKSFAALSEM